ncbi:hypothetical protein J5Y03_10030 [Bacillus sp. RG28]|uniref:Uncharacterized protein n=1 Tax=Gottfriedia endophytica TaxID=2820819 RepID=A0A940SIZ9_9BACI|nr:hypothetical protein [Gottfriedia endophytica]MBP0725525.1 hypothetical protein [Gottfriedia endophytica]
MPTNTPNLGIPKPLGTENFNRANFNNILDQIDTSVGAHLADYVKHPGVGTTTNSTNAYSISLNPAPASYVSNMGVVMTINIDSTGASTLNVNSLGAKKILKANGTQVSNLKANGVYTVRYNPSADGGIGAFIVQGEGASGNAIASDLLSGKTASTDAGDIVGTMPNNGAVGITPGTTAKAIPTGYHNGSGIVAGDVNLTAANILSGVSIFGIAGSAISGKRWATGAMGSGGSGNFQYASSTSTLGSTKLTVSGLTFKPSIIIAVDSQYGDISIYSEISDSFYPKTVKVTAFNGGMFGAQNNVNYKGDVSPASVVNGSFTIPVASVATYTWLAIE